MNYPEATVKFSISLKRQNRFAFKSQNDFENNF